jgi:hypothetical protein
MSQEDELGAKMGKNKTGMRPIDAPLYGYWSALYLSFYSKRLYIDVGKRWRGYAIRYLLLMVALWAIPLALQMNTHFNMLFKQELVEPLSLIPTIYVQNGQASFDKPMPYEIKNTKNEVTVIIDTTGKVTDFTNKYPFLTVLITKEQIALKIPKPQFPGSLALQENSGTPVTQVFSKDSNFVFNGEQLLNQSSIQRLKIMAQVSIYPLVVMVFFGLFLVLFLAFCFLGQLFARMMFSFKITLKQSCRLFMVSTTPMMFVLLLLLYFNKMIPGMGIIIVFILILYYSFAVYSLRTESNRLVNT